MLGNRKLVVDNFAEIEKFLAPYTDEIFWDFSKHTIVPGAVYVIGREQSRLNATLIQNLIKSNTISVVYSNPCEGSEPMEWNLFQSGFTELLEQGRMPIVTGGNVNSLYPQLLYENFLGKIHDFKENIQAIEEYNSKQQSQRPYKFLFLNGRMRHHRKYLLHKFQATGLLDQALWTNLDPSLGVGFPKFGNPGSPKRTNQIHCSTFNLSHNTFPAHYLPVRYEVDRYQCNATALPEVITHNLEAKSNLFKNEWGEIYLNPDAYLDTYFSLVTETVFEHPYSFRTEKIWKPIAIGHPFIVASSQGYYRDLHQLGFKTFGHLIDESFDTIENNQQRIERIVTVVEDLCRQDLASFLNECYTVCKYNQLHMAEMRIKVRQEFPERFAQFVQQYL
jgi:hypothetical protein